MTDTHDMFPVIRADLIASLAKRVQKMLDIIDDMLNKWRASGAKVPTELHIYRGTYDAIDGALMSKTKNAVSLKTHTYKGVHLLRMKK